MKRRANFPDGPTQNKKAKIDNAELDSKLHVEGAEVNDGEDSCISSNEGSRIEMSNEAEEGEPIAASEPTGEEEKVESPSPEVSGPATPHKPKSWSDMPGELRNLVYEYVLMDAWNTEVTLKHFPDGRPKLSTESEDNDTESEDNETESEDIDTQLDHVDAQSDHVDSNFAYSSWGFTQTCKQIMQELRPELVMERTVCTPLWTLNEYIETFHPPDENGDTIAYIKLISDGEGVEGRSVDLLVLLKLFYNHADLDVYKSNGIVWDWDYSREHEMFLGLLENYDDFMDDAVDRAGIKSICLRLSCEDDDEEYDRDGYRNIELGIGEPKDRPLSLIRQISEINKVLSESGIVEYASKIEAEFDGHQLCWVVQSSCEMDLTWAHSSGVQMHHDIHSAHASPKLK